LLYIRCCNNKKKDMDKNKDDEKKKKEEKSFMENSKDFLSTWKDHYADNNKEIIERKKIRDEEAEKEHQEFLENLSDVKKDIKDKTEKLAKILNEEFNGFQESFKKGSASVHEKFQLQKHYDDFKIFLKRAEKKGIEKFNELTDKVEKNLLEVDSSKLTIEKPKHKDQEFEEIMKQAEGLMQNDNEAETKKT